MTLTISPPSAHVGAQRPRLLSVPPYVSSAGAEAVALAASAGLHLDPWQQLVLMEALGESAGGRWAAFEVALIVPRQNGKGSVLEALELAALFLPDPDAPPPLILHSAHEFKTSAEHFRRMRDLIEGAPQLASRVRIVRTAAGSEAIELHSGARLRFVTRTGGSGRGFSADLIVIDEAYNLTAESMAAVLPTMSARPNPQVWYTSSAGMASSDQLERLRERGIRGDDPSLAFFEWSAEPGSDLDDRATWALANPALNIRIPEHFVSAERAALPDEQFARERCGIWQSKAEQARGLDVTRWLTLVADAERGTPVFGLDVDPDRRARIGVAWQRPDGGAQLSLSPDHLDVPAHEAAAACKALTDRWGGKVWLGGAAAGLAPDLEREHVPHELLKVGQFPAACGLLVDAIEAGTVHHFGQPELNVSVEGVVWRSRGTAGEREFDLTRSLNVGPVAAVTRALYGLLTEGATSIYESRGALVF